MFDTLGRTVVRHPWPVITAWCLALVAAFLAPGLDDLVSRDQASFLPDTYESVQAQNLAEHAFAQGSGASATVVTRRTDGAELTTADQARVTDLAQRLSAAHLERVTAVVAGPQTLSPNKRVQLVTVALAGQADDPALTGTVRHLREATTSALTGTGLTYAVTGDAALVVDNMDAFDDALVIVSIVTLALVIGLLLLIYRSPVAAATPVLTVAVVSVVSSALIAVTAKTLDLQLDQSLSTILTVVLYGVGTDYIVFLLFRYRERLRAGDEPRQALAAAVARVGEVIASAAAAIVIAFAALALAVFGGFKSLGPGLGIAVAVMALAAVTLVPAVVALLGPRIFWPSTSWRTAPRGTAFHRLGHLTARRPVLVAVSSGGLLAVLALGILGMHVDYDQLGQLPSDTESARGIKDLQAGFPAGALNPTTVYIRSDDGGRLTPAALAPLAEALSTVPGVGAIMPGGDGNPVTTTADGSAAQINLLLSAGPYTNQALDLAGDTVRRVARAHAPEGTTTLVGGMSSVFADIRDANQRDMKVIFPLAGAFIAVILALLLRSLVAPVYLLLAVVTGFAATLGATVLGFQEVAGRDGVSFSLPVILYLFVVAIGTDYNILMISRLREEARAGNAPGPGTALAIEHAGPSVAAAGVILAGTFASMLLAGVSFLTEMGFAVSVGILFSAFVMAILLVPAVTRLLGHRAWWPGHTDRTDGTDGTGHPAGGDPHPADAAAAPSAS